MQFVFGPVPSRRLGRSLGIDTIPLKTCNWNCVYCQLGRSQPLISQRAEYLPSSEIISEVERALEKYDEDQIDWITFVGSGEPTLHSRIGWLIRRVKAITSIPVAVITNGSLLFESQVRSELSVADAILPTLDAGSSDVFRRINRPHPYVSFEAFIEGLVKFSKTYSGQLWMEVMLVNDLNDTEVNLLDIAKIMGEIQPDKIHITLPTRPPAEVWVEPSDEEGVMRARAILGEITEVAHPAEGDLDLAFEGTLSEMILSILQRHPMTQKDLSKVFRLNRLKEISNSLIELKAKEKVQKVSRYGRTFWIASSSRFPQDAQSWKTKPK